MLRVLSTGSARFPLFRPANVFRLGKLVAGEVENIVFRSNRWYIGLQRSQLGRKDNGGGQQHAL
jgi:hypothetical protein